MSDYDNTNRGSIWPNKKKETDRHPDFTGSVNVDGVDYWVSAWKKGSNAKENAPSLTFSVKRKDEQEKPKQEKPKQEAPKQTSSFDDDIPF